MTDCVYDRSVSCIASAVADATCVWRYSVCVFLCLLFTSFSSLLRATTIVSVLCELMKMHWSLLPPHSLSLTFFFFSFFAVSSFLFAVLYEPSFSGSAGRSPLLPFLLSCYINTLFFLSEFIALPRMNKKICLHVKAFCLYFYCGLSRFHKILVVIFSLFTFSQLFFITVFH